MRMVLCVGYLAAMLCIGCGRPSRDAIAFSGTDFGELPSGCEVAGTFSVTNLTDRDVVVQKMISSCSCVADITEHVKLAPGETREVEVQIIVPEDAGRFSSQILAVLRGSKSSAVVLSGDSRPFIKPHIRYVDLGWGVAGGSLKRTRRLRVDADDFDAELNVDDNQQTKCQLIRSGNLLELEFTISQLPFGQARDSVTLELGFAGRQHRILLRTVAHGDHTVRAYPSSLIFHQDDTKSQAAEFRLAGDVDFAVTDLSSSGGYRVELIGQQTYRVFRQSGVSPSAAASISVSFEAIDKSFDLVIPIRSFGARL